MNPNVAMAALLIIAIVLIVVVNMLSGPVSRKAKNLAMAYQWGIFAGVIVMIIICLAAFWVIPEVGKMITPSTINTGVKV